MVQKARDLVKAKAKQRAEKLKGLALPGRVGSTGYVEGRDSYGYACAGSRSNTRVLAARLSVMLESIVAELRAFHLAELKKEKA